MKKTKFFIAAAGAMLLTACSQDEMVMQTPSDGAIGYSVLTRNQTRAADSYCQNNLPTEFNIWAKTATGALYINGDKIEKNGTVYENKTTKRFWPEEALTFYAYVNGGDVFDYNSGAPKFENFTVKENVDEQVDLMYAVTTDATGDEANPNVTLNFRHALSQVCFKAKNETQNLRITVSKVGVGGLVDKGTYTFPSASTTDQYEDHSNDYYTGDSDPVASDSRGTWALSEDAADAKKYYEVALDAAVKLAPEQEDASNLTCIANADSHKGESWKDVMTLMPQKQDACTSTAIYNETNPKPDQFPDDGAYFKLYLTVENVVNAGEANESAVTLLSNKPFYVPVKVDWAQGYRYTYTLVFSSDWTPDNLVEIGYTVTADDFVNAEGGNTNDPEWWGEEGPKKVLMVEADGDEPAIYVAESNLGETLPFDAGNYQSGRGNYYAWGNLTSTSSFLLADIDALNWTSYIQSNWEEFAAQNILNESGDLKAELDAATNELGEGWHIPTKAEWERLLTACDVTIKEFSGSQIGSNYYAEFTSKTTGGKIILTIPGYLGSNENNLVSRGSSGSYLSSTPKKPDTGSVRNFYGLTIHQPNAAGNQVFISNENLGKPYAVRPFYTAPTN